MVRGTDNPSPGARPVPVTKNTERVGLPNGLTITAKRITAAIDKSAVPRGVPNGSTLNLPSPPLKTGRPVTNQPLKLGAATPAQPTTGNYLITITGLRCVTSTGGDDVLKGDGKGDESDASAYVRRYDRRTFDELEQTNLRTMLYGDISRYPDTSTARSGGVTAAIASGDAVPD